MPVSSVSAGQTITPAWGNSVSTSVNTAESEIDTLQSDLNALEARLPVQTADIGNSQVTTAKVADSAITSAKIANDTIVNADINSAANIAQTKLATTGGTTGNFTYYRVGNMVFVTTVGATSPSSTGTLPSGYRPSSLAYGVARAYDSAQGYVGHLQIATNGALSISFGASDPTPVTCSAFGFFPVA